MNSVDPIHSPKTPGSTWNPMQLTKSLAVLVFIVVVYLSSAAVARADVITFSSLEQAGGSLVHIADPYFESGYRINNGGELYYAQQSNVLYAGSAGLHERISNGLITLSQNSGAAFTLTSIDLSVLHPNGTSPAVVFTGFLVGGGTVTQTFNPTLFGFHTFVFNSSFTNLLSVNWRQGTDELNAHQFDNIVLNSNSPVPEPASMALFGTGLLGLAGIARRRRSRKSPQINISKEVKQ